MKLRQLMSGIVAAILSLSIAATANINDNESNELKELESYGIMKATDGSEYVTRGEMALVSLRLQGIGDAVSPNTASFGDVKPDHLYAGAISTATELGIFSGYPDGNFYPDAHVTLWQAVKVISVSLGYEPYAVEMGGYPQGYIAAGNKLSIFDSLGDAAERELTRYELSLMLSDALDEYPLEQTYGDEINYVRSVFSVREILAKRRGTMRFEGVVYENEHTALYGVVTVGKNQVKINNAVYNTGGTNIAECLGMNVTVFADKESGKVIPTITHFFVNDSEQKQKCFDADEVSYVAKGILKAYEADKEKTYKLSDSASYIYNGKREEPTAQLLEIFDGSYRMIDNDGNGVFDVLFITEKESFVTEKTYYENIYFAHNGKFRGANGINLEEDDDTFVEIYTSDENKTSVDSIKANMGITLVCSSDKSVIKVYISDEKISGTVTGIDAGTNTVYIDDKAYGLALNSDGIAMAVPVLGASYDYCLNYDGKIIVDTNERESEYEYAYVLGSSKIGSFANYSVQLVSSGSRTTETKTTSGVTKVSHRVQNGEVFSLEFADKLDFDGAKIAGDSTDLAHIAGKVIAYKTDSDGKIKTAGTYDLRDGMTTLKLNTDIFAFGGFLGARNFVVGENTKLICVPENIKKEADFSVLVTLRDDLLYNVCPVEIDPDTMIAEAVILVEDMDSTTPASIDSDVKASIVGKVSAVMDDNMMPCYKIQILTGEDITEVLTNGDASDAAKTAAALSTGDVIRYTVNASERLDNIEVLASLYNAKEYFRTNPNTLREKIFGQCYEIKRRRLSENLNEYVDEITLSTGGSSYAVYEALCTDGPPYYIFERKRGTVMHATSDDVLDFVNVSDDASDIYMFVKDAQPQVIVIVKE